MAIARETTTTNIKPLDGAIIRRFTAGSAIAPGELVGMASDGYVDPCDAAALATSDALGVALAPKNQGSAYAAGDAVDVVIYGPVQCLTGATVGAIVYTTDTAGEPGETAGTKSFIVGQAISATVLFVRPQFVALS